MMGSKALLIMSAVLAGSLASTTARAAVVGINFQSSNSGSLGAPVTADAFGVPLADWQNLPPKNGNTTYDPLDVAGGELTLSTKAGNYWSLYSDGFIPSPGDAEVAYGYADDHSGVTVNIGGLSSILGAGESYSVQVVMASDAVTAFWSPTVLSGVDVLGTLTPGALMATPGNKSSGAATTSGNYAITSILDGLTADAITITTAGRGGTGNTTRGTIAGIIIETSVPEPGTGLVLLGGGALLALRRRG